MNQPDLVVLLAGLPLVDDTWPEMPALRTLLSRARSASLAGGVEQRLLHHFNMQANGGWNIVAPVMALGDGLSVSAGSWLCADPVCLEAHQDSLYLVEQPVLQEEEWSDLAAMIDQTYAGDDLRFHVTSPRRAYLVLPAPLDVSTTPTEHGLGWNLAEIIPRGRDAMKLQRLMTEFQMLLHASKLNSRREGEGRRPVSGLWLWGGGECPAPSAHVPWRHVVSQDALCAGLARLHGVDPLRQKVALDEAGDGQPCLWLEEPKDGNDWQDLEQRLFAPLLQWLRQGRLGSVHIEWPAHGAWQIDAKDLRRWWRRRKSLPALLATTA